VGKSQIKQKSFELKFEGKAVRKELSTSRYVLVRQHTRLQEHSISILLLIFNEKHGGQ